jgi:hypothetical protein
MKMERLILIAFLGNYLINNVLAALASLIPAGATRSMTSPQYIIFGLLSAVAVGALTWWYMQEAKKNIASGAYFGIGGFVIAILTVFISGVSGVMIQTGSFSQVASILPNFGPFLMNWSTAVMLAYWVIPAILVGWYFGKK